MPGNATSRNHSGDKSLGSFLHSAAILGCIIFAFFIGTRYIASNTGHEATYMPFMGLVWAFKAMLNGEDTSVYLSGLKLSLVVAVAGILLVKVLFFLFRRSFKKDEGSNDWADTKDLKRSNLLNQDEGIYIGLWGDDYLRENSGEHVITIAPTGSGKGTGNVISNLLSWPGSAIVFDIKDENYRLTSGYRKNELKQKIFVIDFTCSDMIIEKQEIEDLGLNWKLLVDKVLELKWGEAIDEKTLRLTEDPARISRQAQNVFGEDAFKIHIMLRKPHRGSSAAFNPLEEVRMGLHEVRDIQNIAQTLIDPQGEGNPDHWHRLAKTIFSALVLHTLYARKDKTMAGVADLVSDPDRQIYEVLNSMLQTCHDPDGFHNWFDKSKSRFTRTHPIIAGLAREMKDKQFEELSGIVSTTMGFMNLFRDPIIARNTDHSDFRISDIIEGDDPMTVYFIVPPSDLHRVMPLVRLVLNQIHIRMMENRNLIRHEAGKKMVTDFWDGLMGLLPGNHNKSGEGEKGQAKKRRKVLFMIDEFPAFGRLDILKNTLSYMRGYGIRALFFAQDLDQINEIYGRNNSILGQFKMRIYHATNSDATARQISADAGETTETEEGVSYSDNGHESHNIRKVKVPLVTYDEAKKLPSSDAIIFREGQKPIYAKKIVYYNDKWFYQMSRIPPVVISDVIPHEFEFAALTNVTEHKQLFVDDSHKQAVMKANAKKRRMSEDKEVGMVSNSIFFKKSDSI